MVVTGVIVLVFALLMTRLYYVGKKSARDARKRRDAVLDRYYQSVYDEAEEKSGKIVPPKKEETDKRE